MSSPGLRPYNGSVVRKKAPKVGKQGGFMRLCAYCGLILKERDARAQMPSEPAIIRKISAYSVLKIIPRIVRAVTLPSGRQVV